MSESNWGKNQIGFYQDGSVTNDVGQQVAIGVINYSKTPSTVYLFPNRHNRLLAGVKKVVGKQGVTEDSPVLENGTDKPLGTVKEFLSSKANESSLEALLK